MFIKKLAAKMGLVLFFGFGAASVFAGDPPSNNRNHRSDQIKGTDTGNGGTAVVCFETRSARDQAEKVLVANESLPSTQQTDPLDGLVDANPMKDQIASVRLFDLFFKSQEKGAHLIDPGQMTWEKIIEDRLKLVQFKSPFGDSLENVKKTFDEGREYFVDRGVLALDDANNAMFTGANCLLLQTAYQMRVAQLTKIVYDKRLTNRMPSIDRAALDIHERLVYLAAQAAQAAKSDWDPRSVQDLVGEIFDQSFESVEPLAFIDRLGKLGLGVYTVYAQTEFAKTKLREAFKSDTKDEWIWGDPNLPYDKMRKLVAGYLGEDVLVPVIGASVTALKGDDYSVRSNPEVKLPSIRFFRARPFPYSIQGETFHLGGASCESRYPIWQPENQNVVISDLGQVYFSCLDTKQPFVVGGESYHVSAGYLLGKGDSYSVCVALADDDPEAALYSGVCFETDAEKKSIAHYLAPDSKLEVNGIQFYGGDRLQYNLGGKLIYARPLLNTDHSGETPAGKWTMPLFGGIGGETNFIFFYESGAVKELRSRVRLEFEFKNGEKLFEHIWFYENGQPYRASNSQDRLQGHYCKASSDQPVEFYPSGKLHSCSINQGHKPETEHLGNGVAVTCSDTRFWFESGALQGCTLADSEKIDHKRYPKGAVLRFDEAGHVVMTGN